MPTMTSSRYDIVPSFTAPTTFRVYDNETGQFLQNKDGLTRVFSTRAGARKAITRAKRGTSR